MAVSRKLRRADAVATLLLEMVKEFEHDITVEFLEGEPAWRFAQLLGSEKQEKAQGIPVSVDRRGAGS